MISPHENSLFSTILSLYLLLFLYFPFQFIFSPVILFTLILLLYLLRLGASQNSTIRRFGSDSVESDPIEANWKTESGKSDLELNEKPISDTKLNEKPIDDDWKTESGKSDLELNEKPISDRKLNEKLNFTDSFVEWDVRAPLEVIHEEYEGEDAEECDWEANRESQMEIIKRYASLSLFYPESDSDASSEGDFEEWNSPEKRRFRWEEEDDKDGLIEIALDEKGNCEVEEENLIEIDLSPTR